MKNVIDNVGDGIAFKYGFHSSDSVWLLYNLLRGGVDSPLTLESLIGVSVRHIDLNVFYLEADQGWIKSPKLRVKLPTGKTVVCARCDRACHSVPCERCESQGKGANWTRKKTISPAGEFVREGEANFRQSQHKFFGDIVNK